MKAKLFNVLLVVLALLLIWQAQIVRANSYVATSVAQTLTGDNRGIIFNPQIKIVSPQETNIPHTQEFILSGPDSLSNAGLVALLVAPNGNGEAIDLAQTAWAPVVFNEPFVFKGIKTGGPRFLVVMRFADDNQTTIFNDPQYFFISDLPFNHSPQIYFPNFSSKVSAPTLVYKGGTTDLIMWVKDSDLDPVQITYVISPVDRQSSGNDLWSSKSFPAGNCFIKIGLSMMLESLPIGKYQIAIQAVDGHGGEDNKIGYFLLQNISCQVEIGKIKKRGCSKLGTIKKGKTVILENFPNPFNPTTTIIYELTSPGRVELSIYNLLGQRVDGFTERQTAGRHRFIFDGSRLPAGVYLYSLKTSDKEVIRQVMQLVK